MTRHSMRRGWVEWTACALAAMVVAVTAAAGAGDAYDYDAAGRLTRVTYASGRVVDYTYDDAGNITSIVSTTTVAVEPSAEGVTFVNSLRPSEPNPASGEAFIRFSLARQGKATMRFFDVHGRLVQTVFDRDTRPGAFEARVNVRSWAAGVYFYKLEAPGFTATRRLVVLQ